LEDETDAFRVSYKNPGARFEMRMEWGLVRLDCEWAEMTGKEVLGIVLAYALVCAGIGVGWYTAISQAHVLTHSQRVRVHIISAEARGHVDSHHNASYTPIVTFHILTPGAAVSGGNQMFPLQISGGKSWAQKYVDRFKAGADYDGYVSTGSNPIAYLIAKASILPYFFLLIFGGIGFWLARVQWSKAIEGARVCLLCVQVLFGLNLVAAVIHYVWILMASPR